MTKGFHKKVSKRQPLRRRYKIEKRVKQHNKKLKKVARKQKQAKIAHRKAKIEEGRQKTEMNQKAPRKEKILEKAK